MAKRLNSEEELAQINSTLLVLNFWAAWAEPCQHMNEVFDELAKQYHGDSSVSFISVEAEQFSDLVDQFEVSAVPSYVILRKGKMIDRVEGANAAELTSKVTSIIAKNHTINKSDGSQQRQGASSQQKRTPEEANARLKRLVNSFPCMVFMKGTPAQPRCGFSRQLIELLNEREVDYKTFDILADEEVRQGLKTLFNWPTFPQVYFNGELLGGLDIFKEMDAAGEIATTLPLRTKKTKRDINVYLKELTSRNNIMLFMKGTPSNPQCGFSRQIIHILDQEGVAFDHFDILTDDEVRQELKVYSNWPTYPQLYVKGELIGGLDIVQEMKENNELRAELLK